MLMDLSRFLDRTGIFDVFLTPVPVPFKVQIPHLIGAITALRGTLNPVCDAGPARCIFYADALHRRTREIQFLAVGLIFAVGLAPHSLKNESMLRFT